MPKGPLREGYSVAYRIKLQDEFLGPVTKERLGRAPAWTRELVSQLLKEIENRHAEVRGLRRDLRKITSDHSNLLGERPRRRKPRTGGGPT